MMTDTEYPKYKGKHSGTVYGYSVQARYNYDLPQIVNSHNLDKKWRTLRFEETPVGIGVPQDSKSMICYAGYLSYQQAESLRWWFHANAEIENNNFCLETKIVKHSIKFEIITEAVSDHCIIGGEDRSHLIPEWKGKK